MNSHCPNSECSISFVGKEIPLGLFETELYGSMENCEKIAEGYGWTPENKRCFQDHIVYCKDYSDDYKHKFSYSLCSVCGHKWNHRQHY